MRIAVLGATGRTGRQLILQALARGHEVVALARDPRQLAALAAPALAVVAADVFALATVRAALAGVDALVSGLGASGKAHGTLAAGARAVVAAGVGRVVWLGSLGTGASRGAGGPLVGALVPILLRKELADKAGGEQIARAAGATIVHAGPLSNGRGRGGGRLIAVERLDRRLLWPGICRADVAALMLDEATNPRHAGATAIALAG
jgi:uncharacterized protein YbjT (DUF2867 family)